MSTKGLKRFGKKAAASCLALALSVMMVPAVALADDPPDAEVFADGSGVDNAEVNHDDTMTGEHEYGVYAKAGNGKTATVSIGDVAAKQTGVYAESGDDEKTGNRVDVTAGSVRSEDDGVVIRSGRNGDANVAVNGVVEASGKGAHITSVENGKVSLSVDGDITSSTGPGLVLSADNADKNSKGSIDVVVDGTIKGATSGIVLNGIDNEYTTTSLTVWKIEIPDGGKLVEGDEDGSFAKSINYIIKLEEQKDSSSSSSSSTSSTTVTTTRLVVMTAQSDDKALTTDSNTGNLRATDADGNPLAQSHGYDVAREGDRVFLAVEEGYEIVKAYSSGVLLTADENGNYSIVVPRGGGVNLSVIVQAISAADDAAKDKGGKSDSATGTKGTSSDPSAAADKDKDEAGLLAKTADGLPVLPASATLLLAGAVVAVSRRQLSE